MAEKCVTVCVVDKDGLDVLVQDAIGLPVLVRHARRAPSRCTQYNMHPPITGFAQDLNAAGMIKTQDLLRLQQATFLCKRLTCKPSS